jgi:hypothetical protein
MSMRNERAEGVCGFAPNRPRGTRQAVAALAACWFIAPPAFALKIDPKALARFDLTFAPCEARFAEMRGRGDEVFASLWSAKLDAKARAQFSAVRKGAVYVAERRRLVPPAAPPAGSAAAAALEQECRSMWALALGNSASKP